MEVSFPGPLNLLVSCLEDLNIGRYSFEVAFIYPAPWNVVKAAYLFCRYYPLVVAPFHFWGLFADHEQRVCEAYYRVLFACTVPTILSAQFIMMLRTHAVFWEEQNRFSLFFQSPLSMISILTASFDGLNMIIVFWYCIRERGTFGPLGQSFLRQGVIVYVITTLLNMMTIGTTFSSQLLHDYKLIPWFAYIIPSALSCRLVLMLRRIASPTETELRIEYSHMVNEALEMITIELHPEETSQDFLPSTSTYAQAQPPLDNKHTR
ncbi:hypothetical protein EDB83DRAFT_1152927 [Lactarius deliciosus]|nr:hypothetical protein EDB83DRAFT_1152927 [Lactarius deliciosus]